MSTTPSTHTYLILDFNQTLIQGKSTALLIAVALEQHPDREQLLPAMEALQSQIENNVIPFAEGLQEILQKIAATKQHIAQVVALLSEQITDSFLRNAAFLSDNAATIYIVSTSFKELIAPIATQLGLQASHVISNTFLYDSNDQIIGFESNNALLSNEDKGSAIQQLQLPGMVHAIGADAGDCGWESEGVVDTLYTFTAHTPCAAASVAEERVIASFDEFLYFHKLNRTLSYPKSMMKVLLLENVHPVAVAAFVAEGFVVEVVKGALDEAELCERIKDVSILGIRSKTVVTKAVLDCAPKLLAIGAFCIGTNQIAIQDAANKGIPVFNAPYSNTRSVVELALGEMILLIRSAVPKSYKMHAGIWDKSATGSHEIRNKTLGLVGYGNIGTQFSVLAEAVGMKVVYYDLTDRLALGNARRVASMDALYAEADVVSLHVDGRVENQHLIGAADFAKMKDGVILLNLSRGHVVDMAALAAALKSGKVAGAGVDVFPYEPKTNEELFENEICGLDNVILTPHIGGSTEEAQENIGHFVPSKLLEYINIGSTYGAVNFPEVQLPLLHGSHRLLHVHHNVPGIMAQINSVFAQYTINITGQYLKTHADIGYVIIDIEKGYSQAFVNEIKSIKGTLRMRMLY